jgi:hypothetical protein
MRARWKKVIAATVALCLGGCSDSTSPGTQNLVDMILDFCASDVPSFFAFQNDGGAWTKVAADANGSFSFQAADKLIVAFVRQTGPDFSTEVIYTTNADLQPVNGVACKEQLGAKTLNGTVAGVPTGNGAAITMGAATTFVTGPTTAFQLTQVPTGLVDLVANRETFGTSTPTPNGVIVRRGLNLVSTIPVLDFNAPEAVAPAANVLTVGGLVPGESNTLSVYFTTATNTSHLLYIVGSFTSGTQTIYGIPTSLTATSDFHSLGIAASSSSGSATRGAIAWYRNPGDKTVTLGAALPTPAVSTVATTPYVRLRATLTKQDEYNALVAFFFTQTTANVTRDWAVWATAGYFGGIAPATWDLTMPDLSGVAGFPAAGFQTGQTTFVTAEATNARPALFFDVNALPNDQESAKYAVRDISFATSQASVAGREARPGMRSPLSRNRWGAR